MIQYSRGSEWRKWDLHMHTPASYQWQGEKFGSGKAKNDELAKAVLQALEATDVAVFGLMDYWTFDGYVTLKKYLEENPSFNFSKRLLPGMEIRIECAVNYRLNYHVLISDDVSFQRLQEFKSHLRIASTNEPLSDEAIINAARKFPATALEQRGYKKSQLDDPSVALRAGSEMIQLSKDSFEKARAFVDAHSHDKSKKAIVICPFDTYGGLSKLDFKKFESDAVWFFEKPDIFESRDEDKFAAFRGVKTKSNEKYFDTFFEWLQMRPRGVIAGTDAHSLTSYGEFPSGRATWLKANPTFRGLLHSLIEPEQRFYIGKKPPLLSFLTANPTKVIDSISFEKKVGKDQDNEWFHGVLPLNPGLAAVIGNRGSGKSALADLLALSGSQIEEKEGFSFLNSKRFCHPKTGKADCYDETITWADGTQSVHTMSDAITSSSAMRVRYLPQSHIEELCNEIGQGSVEQFEFELKDVIFSHLEPHERLDHKNLDEAIAKRVGPLEREIEEFRESLSQVNKEAAALERRLCKSNIAKLRSAVTVKSDELAAHDKAKPSAVEKPKEKESEQQKNVREEVEGLAKKIKDTDGELAALKVEQIKTKKSMETLSEVKETITNAARSFENVLTKLKPQLESLSIDSSGIVRLEVDTSPLENRQAELEARTAQIIEKIGAEGASGLTANLDALKKRIESKRSELDAPQKKYQEYQKHLAEWEEARRLIVGAIDQIGTLEYLNGQIHWLETQGPLDQARFDSMRCELVRKIAEKYEAYKERIRTLYQPVQDFADTHDFSKEELQLRFNVSNEVKDFASNFMELIDAGKRGSFQGSQDGYDRVWQLMEECGVETPDEIVSLTQRLIASLRADTRGDSPVAVEIESQLRLKRTTLEGMLDWISQLRYIRPAYSLTLGDRKVQELSPGERGILLLIFYLLLDKENIPLIIDQPEHNLDNESVYRVLVKCIKEAKQRRQIIMVTHNPNLAVVCDAEQIILAVHQNVPRHEIRYASGALEDDEMNSRVVEVLEGTWPAFDNREQKYFRTS